MKAGSLEKPEQFVVVDDHTFRVDFIRKDKLTMPDLAVIVPAVYHSELVKKNATEKDPWGLEYTKTNIAGGGAYKVTRWQAGTEVVFERNDDWKSGPLPKVQARHLAHGALGRQPARADRARRRRHLLRPAEQGLRRAQAGRQGRTSSPTPIGNGIGYIGMNCKKPPFNNVKVRQAVAYAIPYQKIMDAVMFGLAEPDVRRQARHARSQVAWPQPHRYTTDIAKAKQLLAEAGYPERLRDDAVVRSGLCRRSTSRCACWCRRAWPRSASRPTINKIPGANWRNELLKKEMPLIANFFSGWLDYPEYFFFWCYHGQNAVFNTMSYQDKDDGRADRRGAHGGGRRRHGGLREEREGLRREGLRRGAAHPAVPAVRSTWRCRRTSPATATGSTASSTTARSVKA